MLDVGRPAWFEGGCGDGRWEGLIRVFPLEGSCPWSRWSETDTGIARQRLG